ncbi:MAG: hypothetical protein V7L04_03195 [Nostoc sp.]|uniref:hypothetical protein n=1 Tax=Nostoc sp. TaxID=1180 RepID=UPI002FFA2EF3
MYGNLKKQNLRIDKLDKLGIFGIGDRRCQNQGSKPLIEDIEQAHLWQVLQASASDADWLTSVTERYITRQRGWEILHIIEWVYP